MHTAGQDMIYDKDPEQVLKFTFGDTPAYILLVLQ